MLFFKQFIDKWKKFDHSFGQNFLLSLYVIYLLFFHFYKNIQTIQWDIQNIIIVLTSFLSLIALHQMIELATQKSKILYQILISVLLITYEYLYLYHYRMWHNFDYSILAANWSEIFTPQAAQLIGDTTLAKLKIKDYVNLTVFFFILFYWGFYKKKLCPRKLNFPYLRATLSITILLLVIRSPYTLYDEISFVAQSAYRYHMGIDHDFTFSKKETEYPYVHLFKTQTPLRRRNVILLAMESFNANFVNSKVNGKELTPHFNRNLKEGLYNLHHYGHSIQTAKGHFSLLCGIPPLSNKKAMKRSPLHLHCLPQILKENGYQTYFIQGFDQKNFDNSFQFMTTNGFELFETTNTMNFTPQERKKYIWGFGVQDNFTFEQAFRTMDHLHQKQPDKPIFTMIATISHHMDFHYVPKRLQFIHRDPHGNREHIENSIYAADLFLKTFFDELAKRDYLKDSLVILTGDHSFPAGEHGYYLNEAGSFKEHFRTPLLILGGEQKGEIKHTTSHQDIAPTILDLLGLDSIKVHFTGSSILSPQNEKQNIPLIQPYDGEHLGGIINNQKYMFQVRTRRNPLYNLTQDPHERDNIFQSNLPIMKNFDKLIRQIHLNDYLINNDLIWPHGPMKKNRRK